MSQLVELPVSIYSQEHLTVIQWLRSIGIPMTMGFSFAKNFNAYIWHKDGGIVVASKAHIGNILHEAGHFAVTPANMRKRVSNSFDDIGLKEPHEDMALAWSYAAAIACEVDTMIPFQTGFKNPSSGFGVHMALERSDHVGIKLMTDLDMTDNTFPSMKQWLRT